MREKESAEGGIKNLEGTRGLPFWQGLIGIFKQGPFILMDTLRCNVKEKGYVICASLFQGEC